MSTRFTSAAAARRKLERRETTRAGVILRGAPARSLLGAWAPPLVFDYPEEVLGVHYQVFFVVKLDIHPRVFA